MTSKPNYLDLLKQRTETKARQIVRIRVCLQPELYADLEDARADLAAAPRARSIAGSDNAAQAELVAEIEAQIRAVTLVVVLRSLNADDLATSRADLKDSDPVALMWKRDLEAAFVRAEDGDGNRVSDVGAPEWASLLDVIAAGEMQEWHGRLHKAGLSPAFPTRAKR